jgi:hypothetical protein
LNQAAPVQNTYYAILDTTTDCRVYTIGVNIEDANESLSLQLTVDGETIAPDNFAATHSTDYRGSLVFSAITRVDQMELDAMTNVQLRPSFVVEGKSVKVELRKTTAAGAGNLTGVVLYGTKPD